jgi:VanZ family protein
MTRRMVLLQAALVAAVLVVACAAALLAVSMEEAESTFPGKNGKIALRAPATAKREARISTP